MTQYEYSRRIEEIDRRLLDLLNERAGVSLELGKLVAAEGGGAYDPADEKRALERVLAQNEGPLGAEALRDVFRAIMAGARALQQPLRVAYLGPAGTFSHEAALERFGSGAEYLPARSIPEVFSAAEKGHADYGVVPVENSTGGAVTHTLDMFVDSELKICAEFALIVAQHLLAKDDLAAIRRVYSHPQAIAQCREWLAAYLPDAELIDVASTSRAAELAAAESGSAAIATETAADLYGLPIAARRIEDSQTNITRFLVIGPEMGRITGSDQTSLIFSIKDRVGALHDALDTFRRHGINMTRIESRPSKRKAWDYLFFVDIIGHPEDEGVATALAELAHECVLVKVLGAWAQE